VRADRRQGTHPRRDGVCPGPSGFTAADQRSPSEGALTCPEEGPLVSLVGHLGFLSARLRTLPDEAYPRRTPSRCLASPLSSPAHPHFSFSRQSRVPDHWYFYLHDGDWGPAMVKCCPYAPYPLWIVANGHEWLKRQLTRAGVAYEALDNGLASVSDPSEAARLAASLSAGHLRRAIEAWLSRLPSPLTPADGEAGFRYDFPIRQLEISDTAVFDAPRRGRAWFEAAIRDHLDLGRPEQVALVVDRSIRSTDKNPNPGRFATEVVARDINPMLQIRYKSSKTKAYLKEGRALRVGDDGQQPGGLRHAQDPQRHQLAGAAPHRRQRQRPLLARPGGRTGRRSRPGHPGGDRDANRP